MLSLMSLFFPFLQVRPTNKRGGVLFAITDTHQKVVELGLALTPVHGDLQKILLYYTDEEQASHSHKAAAFSVPDMTDQWIRFTVSYRINLGWRFYYYYVENNLLKKKKKLKMLILYFSDHIFFWYRFSFRDR